MKETTRTTAKMMITKRVRTSKSFHITLTTWKRDRRIEIIANNGAFVFRENGYAKLNKKGLNQQKVLALLDKQMNVEVPRSHRLFIGVK